MDYKDSFLKYLTIEKNYSPHTIKSYENDLNQFYDFCEKSKSGDPINTDHKAIRLWLVSMMENGVTANSVNRKISSLKTFYKYLIRQGVIDKNPTVRVLSPKTSKKLPVFIEEQHINELLDNFEFGDDYEGMRNKIIIELFYLTGIRESELIQLKIEDINLQSKTIKVLGKRNKERLVPFNKQFSEALSHYLEERNAINDSIDNRYLFLTKKGKIMYPKLVYRVVNKYLEMVTTLEKKSPHILRHTFATHLLNRGADLNAIKELLGHANLSATQVYTHNTFEKLKSIYEQAHPRA